MTALKTTDTYLLPDSINSAKNVTRKETNRIAIKILNLKYLEVNESMA